MWSSENTVTYQSYSPEAQLLREANKPGWKEPCAFSLMDAYQDYAHLRRDRAIPQARTSLRPRLELDFQALRLETLGEAYTESIVTEIVWETTKKRFRNLQYEHGSDLVSMYQRSMLIMLESVSDITKTRYAREILQTVRVWQNVAAVLDTFASQTSLIEQVNQAGFFFTQLPISLGMIATFPELTPRRGQSIPVWLGPQFVTASPPSPIHRQGESSFAWINRLMYLPELQKFAVLQDGLFTAYNQEEISQFLLFANQDSQPDLSTEAAILQYIHELPHEFISLHARQLLTIIVSKIGYFRALDSIDKSISSGPATYDALTQAMLDIFEWEFQRCQTDPALEKSLADRLKEWDTVFLHNAVGGFPVSGQVLFQQYKELYENRDIALQPNHFSAQIKKSIYMAYPHFNIKLDLTKLDCISGGFLNFRYLLQSDNGNLLFAADAWKLLDLAEKNDLRTLAELRAFCQKFDLPVKLFEKNRQHKECPGCHKVPAFIGPCVCAVCHAKSVVTPDSLVATQSALPPSDPKVTKAGDFAVYKKVASLTDLISNDVFIFSEPGPVSSRINGIITPWQKPQQTATILPA